MKAGVRATARDPRIRPAVTGAYERGQSTRRAARARLETPPVDPKTWGMRAAEPLWAVQNGRFGGFGWVGSRSPTLPGPSGALWAGRMTASIRRGQASRSPTHGALLPNPWRSAPQPMGRFPTHRWLVERCDDLGSWDLKRSVGWGAGNGEELPGGFACIHWHVRARHRICATAILWVPLNAGTAGFAAIQWQIRGRRLHIRTGERTRATEWRAGGWLRRSRGP